MELSQELFVDVNGNIDLITYCLSLKRREGIERNAAVRPVRMPRGPSETKSYGYDSDYRYLTKRMKKNIRDREKRKKNPERSRDDADGEVRHEKRRQKKNRRKLLYDKE
ncbi:unnamed protein product [Strongylus vulgaris]|uniref:Uncharacterized protein n=1 Tax=Strongylus vulgaris TaxID=40348 RepID=A0A3P7JFJ8_STRVU|nr:unnamed protein product [Strongylus vulgaris]